MTHNYFHEDLSSWSESGAVKEAISEARATSDLALRNASTRRANDDQERRAELSLGEILFHFPNAIMEVAKATPLTPGALRERRDVYAATVEAGVMDELLAMTLSYTNHRGLIGIRVKSAGGQQCTIEERLAAAYDSIERNNGVFKEDDAFFEAINVLPPPNNFNRVMANLARSPEYADKKLGDDHTFDQLIKVVREHNARRGREYENWPKPEVPELDPMGYLGLKTSRVSSLLGSILDLIEEVGEVPIGVLLETENWMTQIQSIRQRSMKEPVR